MEEIKEKALAEIEEIGVVNLSTLSRVCLWQPFEGHVPAVLIARGLVSKWPDGRHVPTELGSRVIELWKG